MQHSRHEQNADILSNLIDTYGLDVWNLAFTLSRSADVADDVYQDVFLNVWRKLHTFRGQSSWRTWLLAITHNVARNHLRSSFLRRVVLVDHLPLREPHRSAEDEALECLDIDAIWQRILQLPVKLREVLVLRVSHQLSIAEISQVVGIPSSTVKTRLHRARLQMYDAIQEVDVDDRIQLGENPD